MAGVYTHRRLYCIVNVYNYFMSPAPAFFFSVVIPALNEEHYLPILLRDLSHQSFFLDHLEIVVVDGNSEDKTREQVEKFQGVFPHIQLITTTVRNVSHQRNLGAAHAQGEWIIFMDADNRLPSNFLDDLRFAILHNADYQLFTTWTAPDDESSTALAITQLINYGTDFFQYMGKPAAMGAMIIANNRVLRQVQFNEKQTFMEDALFVQTACDAGFRFRILHEPRFIFSLRRMRREGSLKLLSGVARLQLEYIIGKTIQDENPEYPMLGGSYYNEIPESFFQRLSTLIRSASAAQIKQWKNIFRP